MLAWLVSHPMLCATLLMGLPGCPGRADYYGALPNLAARISTLAAPGQILVEGSAGFHDGAPWERRWLPYS